MVDTGHLDGRVATRDHGDSKARTPAIQMAKGPLRRLIFFISREDTWARVTGSAAERDQCIQTVIPAVGKSEVVRLKNCDLCRYSHLCNPMPALCILAFYVAVAVMTIGMAYLFVVEELF